MMANQIEPSLPKEYVQLEYLESTGTQWIDTGIKGNQDTKVEIKYFYYKTSSSNGRIFGSRQKYEENEFVIGTFSGGISSGTNFFVGYGMSSGSDMQLSPIIINDWFTIIHDRTTHSVNGVNYPYDYTYRPFETPQNLKIFGFDNNDSIGDPGIGRCAYVRIWSSNIIVRDFIPALRKADLKPGMYDLVSGQFFTNQGTGEFVFEMPNELKPYLYFEALRDGLQVSITKSATQYSLDKVNWIDLPATESTPPINKGRKIYFKGNAALNNTGIGTFTLTKLCKVGGNPNSLHYGDSLDKYDNINSLQELFKDNQNLLEIVNPETFIPNKTGGRLYQYTGMFEGCSNLINAPIIYIETAGNYALRDMFRGASNINYVVMLAEQFSESYPVQTWLYKAASSGTIVLNKNITWNPSEVDNLIPNSNWTVKYCDPDNIDDVRDYREKDQPW